MSRTKLNLYGEALELKEGITVLLHCLNNEADVGEVLQTIVENEHKVDQIIVVDGGSIDKTVEVAKRYTDEVYVTERGFCNQQNYALSKIKFKFFLYAENDHRYPRNFISSLLNELLISNFIGIQATLICDQSTNYFEKGIDVFYRIHQMKKGERDVIGGGSIYRTSEYIQNIDNTGHNGYSIDTNRAEVLKKKGFKFGLGNTIVFQHQKLDFKKVFRKYFNYGRGDYDFYKAYAPHWKIRRKLKSIFHVFNRYVIDYSLKTFKIGKPQYIPFFWMSAIFRYFGWFSAILHHKKKGF